MKLEQEYIRMRNNNNFSTSWFYKYWLENGGKSMKLSDFEQHFFYNPVFNDTGDKIGQVLKDISPLLENLDKKFNITILINNKGQFLKVVV